MNKLFIVFRLIVVTFFLVPFHSSSQNIERMNILLIMTDDQGWFDAGFNGNTQISTPHLDALAGEGMILKRFYAAAPVCSPTRASVQTGRNPWRTNITNANNGYLKDQEITIAELLKNEGYVTGHFGKWHLGTLTRQQIDGNRGGRKAHDEAFNPPSKNGYDQFFCTESKVPTFDPLSKPVKFDKDESLRFGWVARSKDSDKEYYGTAYWVGEEKFVQEPLEGSNSQLITDKLISFIDNAKDKKRPFFSTVWYHTPHLPLVAPEEQLKDLEDLTFEQRMYRVNLLALDQQIGRLWKYLKEHDLADNTMIWFCSDNGPERDTPGSAGIFRGQKRLLYEGGIRVPAFVVWKGKIQAGSSSDMPMVTSDYLPTILSVLDIEYPSKRALDGIDLTPALHGKMESRNKGIGFLMGKQEAFMDDRYKIIRSNTESEFELYDLINDPAESIDLMSNNLSEGKRLKASFQTWRNSVEKSMKGADYQ